MLITAVFAAWAGILYGAYAWDSNKGPSDSMIAAAESKATLCSIGRKDFQDAHKALDKVITINIVSLPLRAWARGYSDSTQPYIKALVEEAGFQEQRRQRAEDWIASSCFPED